MNKIALSALTAAMVISACQDQPKNNEYKYEVNVQPAPYLSDSMKRISDSLTGLEKEVITRKPDIPMSSFAGNTDDAYEKIHIAFEGMPDIDKVKPMLEAVMIRYGKAVNNENVLRHANVLVALRQDSKVGVTEMEILKHMYQRGTEKDYQTQAAVSATILESTK